MTRSEVLPSAGALEEIRRLAGSSAVILAVRRLEGGQHADTWRVDTDNPARSVVLRQFPLADSAPCREERVLGTLDGLGGLAPVSLGIDVAGRWSERPTSLISWLDGESDITPSDPRRWARELGRALALVHAVGVHRLSDLPSVFAGRGSQAEMHGPLSAEVRARWPAIVASPGVLTHTDYWSGNLVWRDGALTGIVDWSGAARGPRAYDVGWCRLDLVLLFDELIANVFLAAYELAIGQSLGEVVLGDAWALARSHDVVESWAANYAPLGRGDLNARELRQRHSRWTTRLMERM